MNEETNNQPEWGPDMSNENLRVEKVRLWKKLWINKSCI